jgi:ABC-type multidrug transport system ATPase subunit
MELRIDRLGKRYKGGEWGLRGLTLALDPGTVLGLVGPAGAGKTTLLRLLATVMPPTEGTIAWDGGDVVKRPGVLRQVLGYLPQYFGVYAGLSGRAFLRYLAALKGIPGRAGRSRVSELIGHLGLSEMADRAMGRYPNDARWRVGLGQALLNDPQLLLVDEPGMPLNAEERSRFYDLLGGFTGQRTVVVATDDVEDVASIATAIALLRGGRLLVPDVGTGAQPCIAPDRLLGSVRDRVWSLTVSRDALVEVRREHLISQSEREGNQTRLRIVAVARPHPDAVSVDPTLRDAYAYHMGSASLEGQ